jgi:hypothetical protein
VAGWLRRNQSSVDARRVWVDGAPGFSIRRLAVKKLLLVLLLVASPVFAEVPTLKLPAEVKGEPGTFIAIRAETDSAWVNFRADPGLAVFPSGLLSDRKATVLTAARPGRYKLFAYTGNEDGGADAEVVIIVGNAPPAPPVVVTPPVTDPTVPPVVEPPAPTTKATAATYVYEKDSGGVPSAVMAGLNKVNRDSGYKILAMVVEDDPDDGTGDIPEQNKVALKAARDSGLPALVVTAGDVVLRIVKGPTTQQQITEAVK